MMRKVVITLIIVAFCNVQIYALGVSACSGILMDGMTGEVIFEKNADVRRPMASTTKIMTALTALRYGDMRKVSVIKREHTLAEGSSMYLREGQRYTLRELLYGLMLCSGNDAALAVAENVSGNTTKFVAKMNILAKELNMNDTHFENPSGLDGAQHYTTARDMAILSATAMRDNNFKKIVSSKYFTCGNQSYKNHNRLLWAMEGAEGVKTGFTKKSGRCLVSAASRFGRSLIAVTLNAPDDWSDHKSMMEYGFGRFSEYIVCKKGEFAIGQRIVGGNGAAVALVAEDEMTVGVTDAERAKCKIIVCAKQFEYAPIKKGELAGTLEVHVNGAKISSTKLVYESSISEEAMS